MRRLIPLLVVTLHVGCAAPSPERRWLAGDHHIHSHFSGDGRYAIPKNAEMARA